MILNSLIRSLLEKELESVAIRLNKRAPDVYFKVITCTCVLLEMSWLVVADII